jgi:hypothetical protein
MLVGISLNSCYLKTLWGNLQPSVSLVGCSSVFIIVALSRPLGGWLVMGGAVFRQLSCLPSLHLGTFVKGSLFVL